MWLCQWFSLGTPVSSTNKTDLHEKNWNIEESGAKHHNPNPQSTRTQAHELTSMWSGHMKSMNNDIELGK